MFFLSFPFVFTRAHNDLVLSDSFLVISMIRIRSGATWIRLSAIASFTTTFFTAGNLVCLILSAARWRCSFSYNLHQRRYGKRVFVTDGRRVTLVLIIKKNSFLFFTSMSISILFVIQGSVSRSRPIPTSVAGTAAVASTTSNAVQMERRRRKS